jgi:hypothetical protein
MMQQALVASANSYYADQMPGGPSNSQPQDYTEAYQSYGNNTGTEPSHNSSRKSHTHSKKMPMLSTRVIGGNPERMVGEEEFFDTRYKVEHSQKFFTGAMFKILWPEPMGHQTGGKPQFVDSQQSMISDYHRTNDYTGQQFYVGFRRFIVVKEFHGSSLCIPILTYNRYGCGKRGVDANHHGIVYNAPNNPVLTDREIEQKKYPKVDPVRVNIDVEDETLAPESRVNYAKFQTIEHNVRVFFIGAVDPEDLETILYAIDRSLNKRPHKDRRKK